MPKKLFSKQQEFAERLDSFGNVIVYDAAYEEAIAFAESIRDQCPRAEHRLDNNTMEHSVWDCEESDVREGQSREQPQEKKEKERVTIVLSPEDLAQLAALLAEKLKPEKTD